VPAFHSLKKRVIGGLLKAGSKVKFIRGRKLLGAIVNLMVDETFNWMEDRFGMSPLDMMAALHQVGFQMRDAAYVLIENYRDLVRSTVEDVADIRTWWAPACQFIIGQMPRIEVTTYGEAYEELAAYLATRGYDVREEMAFRGLRLPEGPLKDATCLRGYFEDCILCQCFGVRPRHIMFCEPYAGAYQITAQLLLDFSGVKKRVLSREVKCMVAGDPLCEFWIFEVPEGYKWEGWA